MTIPEQNVKPETESFPPSSAEPVSALHAAARAAALNGVPLVPLAPNSKIPLIPKSEGGNGVDDATTDLAQIDAWWTACPSANIAWCPEGAGMSLIDLDTKKADGIGTWNALCVEHGIPQATGLVIGTPSGGRHICYSGSLPPRQSVWPGIDTRGRHSYGILPPSVIDGVAYTYLAGDETIQFFDLPEVPDWIVKKCEPKVDKPRKASSDYVEDKPEAIRQAELWLKLQSQPVEFAGSDGQCYAVAARLLDFGLSEERVLDMMAEWSGFEPEWLQEKIDHAEQYKDNEDGCDTPTSSQEAFGAAVAAGLTGTVEQPSRDGAAPSGNPDKFALFSTGKDRRLRNPGPIEELIPGLIEKRCVAYLSGPGGLNKSRIAFHWGACIHTGTDLYGKPVERAYFVHVSYENGPDEDARRHHTLLRRLGIDPAALDDYTACDWKGRGPLLAIDESAEVAPTELWLALERKLRGIPGHKFIVFDSTYNVFAFLGNSKINETAVQRAIDWLDNKMVELDATGLMITHPSQAGIERGDNSGWSVAWTNRPRVRISVKPVKDMPTSVELEVVKRNNNAKRPAELLHWIDGLMLPSNTNDEQLAAYRACVEVALSAANGGEPINNGTRQDQSDYCRFAEEKCGIHQTPRQLKRHLHNAVLRGNLEYRQYDKNRGQKAGWYPSSRPSFPPPDNNGDE